MYYQKTEESLREKLVKDGFTAYPAQPSKYWNPDGRVVWTDGAWYQDSRGDDWEKYDKRDDSIHY